MGIEAREIDVDGTTYRLRPWSYEDGAAWMHRLFTLAMSARAGLGGLGAQDAAIEGAAIGMLADAFDAKTFVELRKMVEKYTDVISHEDGSRQPLSKIAATHMVGRYVDLALLIRAHLEAEFGPFFRRLGEVLAGPGRAG